MNPTVQPQGFTPHSPHKWVNLRSAPTLQDLRVIAVLSGDASETAREPFGRVLQNKLLHKIACSSVHCRSHHCSLRCPDWMQFCQAAKITTG